MSWLETVEGTAVRFLRWLKRWRTLRPLRILERGVEHHWRTTRRLEHPVSWRQLQYLPQFLTKHERRTVVLSGVAALAALLFLLMRLYTVYLPDRALSGGEYIEGIVGAPKYPHPFYAPLNPVDADLAGLLYRGLVRLGENGSVVRDAAESFTVSSDGLVYTFVLKNNLKFHDGHPLRASDVVWTFEQVRDPRWQSPLQVSFQNVEVFQMGEYAVEFRLSKPSTPFISSLTLGILPAHLWLEVAPEAARNHEFMRSPVGSGAWQVQEIAQDQRSAIVKAYHLKRAETQMPPYLEHLTLRFYNSWDEVTAGLKDRSIDGVAFVPGSVRDEALRQHRFQFVPIDLPQYTAVFLQTGANSALDDVRVRKALNISLDRRELAKIILRDEARPLSQIWIPGFIDEKAEAPDLDGAKAALSAAGWIVPRASGSGSAKPDPGLVVRQKGKDSLRLTLTTADTPEYTAVANWLSRAWQELGVQVALQIVPASEIVREVIQPRKFEALLYAQILGADPDPYPFWHSSQEVAPGLNLTNYLNRRADQLLDEARHQIYQEGRRTRYQEWTEAIAIDLPAIFLYRPSYWYVVGERVYGVEGMKLTSPSARVWIWDNWYRRSRKTVFGQG